MIGSHVLGPWSSLLARECLSLVSLSVQRISRAGVVEFLYLFVLWLIVQENYGKSRRGVI